MGRPRATGFLAVGRDPVAVDATCARAIGLDPARLPYLAEAAEFLGNLEERRIRQRGERGNHRHPLLRGVLGRLR